MNTSERSIYFDLLNCVYEYGGALPNNPEKLAVLAAVSPEELKKAWPIVGENFVARDDGTLTNLVALEVMETQTNLHAAKSTAGKKGAEARWQGHLSANGNREEKTRGEKTREEKNNKKISCPSADGRVSDFSLDSFTEGKNPKKLPSGKSKGSAEQAGWFEQFWKSYWRHESKKPAFAAFIKQVTTLARFQEIMAAIDSQRERMLAREPQFRPLAATWLNAERFADEVTEAKQDPLLLAARKFDERKNQ